MKYQYLVILITLFLFSCSERQESTNRSNADTAKISEMKNSLSEEEDDSDGYDTTITYSFSNGKSICLFGNYYEYGRAIYHISINDCQSGDIYAKNDGEHFYYEGEQIDRYQIELLEDTIEIKLTRNLPAGKNWEIQQIQIGKQLVTVDNDEVKISKMTPYYEHYQIDDLAQKNFWDSLYMNKGQGFGEHWWDDIRRLEVLALNGNQKAWKMLQNYEQFIGQERDGEIAGTWEDAVATVKWIKGIK